MFSVLKSKVLTSKGKEIVNKYLETMDAQSVIRDLCEHYTTKVHRDLMSRKYHSYIVRTTYGPTWKGNVQSFIVHFMEQITIKDQ